jgi:hypothetical protein
MLGGDARFLGATRVHQAFFPAERGKFPDDKRREMNSFPDASFVPTPFHPSSPTHDLDLTTDSALGLEACRSGMK